MHIEHFKEFITLAELLNYSIAAEHLYLTQPVLSRHIIGLEKYLGVRLFSRSTQNVKLTAEGRFLYENLPSVTNRLDHLITRVKQTNNNEELSVTLGSPFYAVKDYLRDVPSHLKKHHANLDFKLVMDDPNELIRYLYTDKVDIIVVPNIPFSGSGNLVFFNLYDERLGILCNKKDSLAKREEIDLKEIKGRTILSVESNYFDTMWKKVVDYCSELGFTPSKPILYNQIESVLMEIDNSSAITIIGQHMRNATMYDVKFIPFSNDFCFRRISLCHKRDNNNPAIGILKSTFKERFSQKYEFV